MISYAGCLVAPPGVIAVEQRHSDKGRGFEGSPEGHGEVAALDLANSRVADAHTVGELLDRPSAGPPSKADTIAQQLGRLTSDRRMGASALHLDSLMVT